MTDIEICNVALGALGTAGVSSFDDDSDQARACKTFYTTVRDAVLEDVIWSFAKKQYRLTPDATAPTFGWLYSFEIPSEVARVHRVDDGAGDYRMSWEIIGRFICADEPVIYVTAVKKEDDSSLYSSAFCLALAARLASELCIPLTQNRTLQADLWQLYQQKIKDAAGSDGSQGKSERVRSDRLSRVR